MVLKKQENRTKAILLKCLQVTFWVSAFLIMVMAGIVAYDALVRYVFNRPSRWIGDAVAYYLMAGITFIPAAWILRKGGHPSVRLVIDRLKPRNQRVLRILNNILGLVYSLVLAWYGWLWTYEEFTHHYTFSTAIPFPTWPAACIVFVGGLILCPVCVVAVLEDIRWHGVTEGPVQKQ